MELKYLVDTETFDETLDEETREIAKLIDTLKEMALVDKRAGVPTIVEFDQQLQELYPKRKELDEKSRKLKETLANQDNFIDRELELNDEQELLHTKKDINELLLQQSQYQAEKVPYTSKKSLITKNIAEAESEVKRLSNLNRDDFKDAIDVYNEGIAKDQEELAALENTIRKYDDLIAEINRKLLPLNKKKEDLEHKLETPYLYIDTIKKNEVEKEYESVTSKLAEIDVAIGTITNHPVYLASTARIPLKSNGFEILKNIINQLTNLATKVPHMDTPESEISTLDEKKATLIKERDKAYREKQNSNGLVKPLDTRKDSFTYDEEELENSINEWLAKTHDKQNTLVSEAKKVLEDKNRLAEELDYRRKLKAEDTKTETLKETKILTDIKTAYDQVYDSYIQEITAYQNVIESLNNILSNELNALKESYSTDLATRITASLDTLKEHKISFLGTKSRIDQEVEKLMMEVVGIDHRKKFSNSPSEIEEQLNTKIANLQTKFDAKMHTFFAPEKEEKEDDIIKPVFAKDNKPDLEEESPLPMEEVPIIDLNDDTYTSSPVAEYFGTEEEKEPPKEETPLTYVHEPVQEFFGEPKTEEEPNIATGTIPVFNPVNEEKKVPDLESGEPIKVTDVQELGIKADEDKGKQADFTTIIPQADVPKEEVDLSELDRIINGSVGRGR